MNRISVKLVLAAAALLISQFASAECWKITDLAGYTSKQFDGYEIEEDGLRKTVFSIVIDGENSGLIPNNGMNCSEASSTNLVCFSITAEKSTFESWSVDPQNSAAYYVKSVNGWGQFNGATMFVGKAEKGC